MGHPDGRRPRPRARTSTHARTRTHTCTHAHRRAHATAHTHTHTPQHANASARTHTHTHANAPRTRTRASTSARARASTSARASTRDDPPRQSAATACVFLDGLDSPRSRKTRIVHARPAPQPGGAKRVGRSGAPTSTASPCQRRPKGSNRHPPGEHDEGPDSSATHSCQTGLWPMTGLRSEGGAHHGPQDTPIAEGRGGRLKCPCRCSRRGHPKHPGWHPRGRRTSAAHGRLLTVD